MTDKIIVDTGVGGFIDFVPEKKKKPCLSPEHEPPSMIVLPAGKHTYQCPACGKKTTFTVSGVYL